MLHKFSLFKKFSNVFGGKVVIRWKTASRDEIVRAEANGHPLLLRARSTDLPIAVECLTSEYSSLKRLFPKGYDGVLIDAGGHIGCAAIVMATMFPNATIICIEPAEDNLKLLRENVRPYPNVEIRKGALVSGVRTEKIALNDRGKGGSGYTIVDRPVDVGQTSALEKVDGISIESLVEEFGSRIGFLKLDIEGAEIEILESQATQRIPAVFAELHERIASGSERAFDRFSRDRWTIQLGFEKFLSLVRDEKPQG